MKANAAFWTVISLSAVTLTGGVLWETGAITLRKSYGSLGNSITEPIAPPPIPGTRSENKLPPPAQP